MEKTGTKQNKSTAAMEEITERVLSDLAKGVMPWEKDWFPAHACRKKDSVQPNYPAMFSEKVIWEIPVN